MTLRPKLCMETAANGHLMVNWPDARHSFYVLLSGWLSLRHGLRRAGHWVVSPDDIILPDFVGKDIRLKSGWDNWSGYYLLSEDRAGDEFLRRFTPRDVNKPASSHGGI